MTILQAPRGKVAQRLLSATPALVLSAWLYPALAATGTDARSDQPTDADPISLSADREPPIQAVGRGAVETESASLADAAAETNAQNTAERPQGPRVEIMLRRIFDEAQARQPKLQQLQADDEFNAPLAVDKSETQDDPSVSLEADPAEAAAQFPGFGDDELLRYRQQMYRTDI